MFRKMVKMTKKSLYKILPLILVAVFISAPLTTHAAFVTCGGDGDPCTFGDLVIMIVRIINYLMAFAGVVAMYYVLVSGFFLITALGNPERIEKAKNGLSNAVVGFAMVALSFVFVNLVVNGILGSGGTRPWYSPGCLNNLIDNPDCPLGS